MDVAELISSAPGFVQVLAPRVVTSGPEQAVLRLDDDVRLHNHVGGPHAAAIFGLGETTAFAVLLEVFGDLVEAGAVPLVKAASIGFTALATGPLRATGALAGDGEAAAASARASYDTRGVAVFDVQVVFTRESDGAQTGTMTASMALRALR